MDENFLLTPIPLPLWVTPVFQRDWCCWHILITRQKRKMRERSILKCISMHKKCERKKIRGKDRGEASKCVRSGKTEMTDLLASILNIRFLPCENTSTESNIPLLIQFSCKKAWFSQAQTHRSINHTLSSFSCKFFICICIYIATSNNPRTCVENIICLMDA